MQHSCILQWVHIFFAEKVFSTGWKVWQPGERVLRYIQDRGPQARVQSISPKQFLAEKKSNKFFSDPKYQSHEASLNLRKSTIYN